MTIGGTPDLPVWFGEVDYSKLAALGCRGWASVAWPIKWFDDGELVTVATATNRNPWDLYLDLRRRTLAGADPVNHGGVDFQALYEAPLRESGTGALLDFVDGENKATIVLDLDCPDALLLGMFEDWLRHKRKAHPVPVRVTGPKTAGSVRFTDTQFHKWIAHRVVELADLEVWGALSGAPQKNAALAPWLFPYHRGQMDPEQRVTEARAVLRDFLDSRDALLAQANAEQARKNSAELFRE